MMVLYTFTISLHIMGIEENSCKMLVKVRLLDCIWIPLWLVSIMAKLIHLKENRLVMLVNKQVMLVNKQGRLGSKLVK